MGLWRSATVTGAIALAGLVAVWLVPEGGGMRAPPGPTEGSIRRAASRGKR